MGETLTADVSGIADADGLTSVAYSYQWISNDGTSDTHIAGATSSTYTLMTTDVGKTIKVEVNFTDDAGFNETLTSTATDEVSFAVGKQGVENSPATGAPTITGTPQVGETLTADTSGIDDADGLRGATFGYQWFSHDVTSDTDIRGARGFTFVPATDIAGATGSTYTLVAVDEGKIINVRVSFTDDAGFEETLTSTAASPVISAGSGASGQSGSEEVSYITVAVTENTSDPNNIVTNFTVTWSDADDCSTDYNAYLNIEPGTLPGYETPGSQRHLGSAASDSAQIANGVAGIQGGGFNVELHCGTDGSGRLVSRVDVPFTIGLRPKPGTYSSEPPLSALSVSHGTLTPAFNSYTSKYNVPDVANEVTRITITATPKEGYAVDHLETAGDWVFPSSVETFGVGGSGDCGRGYSDGNGPMYERTDADPNTPGFQVELYDGENHVHVRVYPTSYCHFGEGYDLAITRADGTVSVVRPNRSPVWDRPHISGLAFNIVSDTRDPWVGNTLDANVHDFWDRDGWDTATFSYQWLADDADITGATDSSYTVTDAELGKTLKVRVIFTDKRGTEESVTSYPTNVVKLRNFEPTGKPVILGKWEVGQTLTADVSGIRDPNGMTNATFSYLWPFPGSRGSRLHDGAEYTLVDRDEGINRVASLCTCRVTVTYTDDAGHEEKVFGETHTEVVAVRSDSRATGAPTITGNPQVGATLTADTSSIADADGLTNVSYSFQWFSNDGTSDADITGATSSTYVLVTADEGKTVKVRVSFTDDEGYAEKLTSAPTSSVAARPNNSATGTPAITGTAQVGETLTADTSSIADAEGLANVSYSYQWVSNDGTSDTEIPNATDSTYILVASDEGNTIKVKVSFTDDADNDETLTSVATASVLSAGEGVSGQSGSEGVSYITVEVTEDTSDPNNIVTSFTVDWSDSKECSTNYNTYLNVKPHTRPGHETPGSQVHLGSATSSSTQLTKGPTSVQGPVNGFNVEVYCGTEGSGRLVSRVDIPWSDGRPKPGTYSSEPLLSALTVSHGTLTPAFNSYTSRYTVPDVANDVTRLTINVTPKAQHIVDFFDSSGGHQAVSFVVMPVGVFGIPSGLDPECARSIRDSQGRLPELTDADPDTPGFQVDLYDDESRVYAWVYPTEYCALGEGYVISITRAAGSVSVVRPNRPPYGRPNIGPDYSDGVCPRGPCVGLTMEARVSHIRDRDGMASSTFSYQWLADDVEITGATSSSYTVTDSELGKILTMRVTYTDDRGTEETITNDTRREVRLFNVEPTGKPIIVGTWEVGQTLTADVSGISDANGLTNATFSYRWTGGFHGPVDGREYTLVDRDERVCYCGVYVSYTDDAGWEEEVSSDYQLLAVAARSDSRATGAPTISGTAQVGETLTADTSGIADADGLSSVSYNYQWISSDGTADTDITGATSSTYTLVASDEGNTIKVRVNFTDDAGYAESLTSTSTASVIAADEGATGQGSGQNTPATGVPTISGTAQVGETLTADISGIADADGLTSVSYSYQWVSNDGTSDTNITGATSSTYTLVTTDEGNTIKVRVSFTDDSDNEETLTSEATAAVTAAEPDEPPARPQGLTGTVAHDAVSLTWDDPGDASITGYQILRRDRALHDSGDFQLHVNDTGSAAAAYIDRDVSPEGSYVYRIKARNAAGLGGRSGFFRADTPSAPAQNSPATGAPAITGTVQVGEMLTADLSGIADADGLSGVTFSYQWISNDGTVDTDIVGATGSIYTLAASDEGKSIKVRVTFTDDAGYGESLISAATAAVASQNSPVIEGVLRVGETLTVDTSGIANLDGLSGVTFSYQWISNDGTTDMDITGATDSTYTLTASDEGKIIKVRVTFTLTSAATEEVEAEDE